MMSLGLKNLQQNLQPFALALTSKGLTPEPSQIAEPTVFQVVLRRLGKSFQSTITASQVNLSDYNATAQSYFKKMRIVIEWNGYAAAMWRRTSER